MPRTVTRREELENLIVRRLLLTVKRKRYRTPPSRNEMEDFVREEVEDNIAALNDNQMAELLCSGDEMVEVLYHLPQVTTLIKNWWKQQSTEVVADLILEELGL